MEGQRTKRRVLTLVIVGVAVLLGAILGRAQSVFPVRFDDPQALVTPPSGLVAEPDALVLGNGAIALYPDLTINQEPFGATTGGKKVMDASCSVTNRGEIRIINLDTTPDPAEGDRNFDALCFCQRSVVDGAAANYWWACLKVQ